MDIQDSDNIEQFSMNDFKWCPSHWLDEVVPCLVADPAEIVFAHDGKWLMLADRHELDDEEASCRETIEPGQIVNFAGHRNYGEALLIVHRGGSYQTDRAFPDDATHFARLDTFFGELFDSLDELVKEGNLENGIEGGPLSPGAYEIVVWHWSDGLPFRFELHDGKPAFVRCAGAS